MQTMRLGALRTRGRACRNGRHRTPAYSQGWPGPFGCPTLSSSFRWCCAAPFNATADPYPGDPGLGEKQFRPTFNDPGDDLARWPVVLRSDALEAFVNLARQGAKWHSHRDQTLSAQSAARFGRTSQAEGASSFCFRKVIPVLTRTIHQKPSQRSFFRSEAVLPPSPLRRRSVSEQKSRSFQVDFVIERMAAGQCN